MDTTDLPHSPAADRNKAPILEVLERVLPAGATVLEIASGTGQHAAHFATARPDWTWLPTDATAGAMAPIAARTAGIANVQPPLHLDVLADAWPRVPTALDAVYCANMIHIAPWATCPALMRGAARHLAPGGVLVLYGPYIVDGEPVAPGNAAFDADLRERDPTWGLRRLSQVVGEALLAGLAFESRHDLPANNLMLALRRLPDATARFP